MIAIGIDPSLRRTGLVVIPAQCTPAIRVLTPPPTKRGADRLVWFYDTLRGIMADVKGTPVLAAIENYSYASTGRIAQLGELGGVIRVVLRKCSIPYVLVAPSQLKKYLLGSSKGTREESKKKIITAVKEIYPQVVLSDSQHDEADALGLALIAQALLTKESSSKGYQRDVITKIQQSQLNM